MNDQPDPLADEQPISGDDPFAGVPNDPLGEEPLPPGVLPGSLGGTDAPPAPDEDGEITPPQTEDEFLQEPPEAMPEEEPDELPFASDEEPPPEESVAEEPETGPTSSPGDPGVPGEPVSEENEGVAAGPEEPEVPEAEPEPEKSDGAHESEDDPPTSVEGSSDSPPEGGNPPEAVEEPKPAAEKPKPKRKRRKSKAKKSGDSKPVGPRDYVVLQLAGADGATTPTWTEAFPREIPYGTEGSEPVKISARTGELALRTAYRRLSDNQEGHSYELVPVPAKLFKPQPVSGKLPESALAIKIG